ncbi:MAG: VWA domain-containing protein [Candidatus Marinimicrobia bacterium]|nr:VWA domain-containing protein [Candidatus Neomarinimicrobiota bacterium]MCH8069793.1 VWA domain-containing protein [Candidatus Neomarinimicrobiota bacterium]
MFKFASPLILLLLPIVPFIAWWYHKRGEQREGTIQFSSLSLLKDIKGLTGKGKIRFLLGLRLLAITLLILALAKPQVVSTESDILTEVIDIILVLDISSSMLAEDFKPNRLEAAKVTAREFIENRKGDRIGLVVFAGESYIQCPLTIDYDVLKSLLDQVTIIDEQHDGTAIGMALAHSLNRLRGSHTKSKVIVLLSDGSNNAGELDPITASGFARDYGVKIYTVGVGSKGKAPYPVNDPIVGKRYVQVDVDMDEETLKRVAETADGKYFRATDEESLLEIYNEISRLERSEIKVKEFHQYEELFGLFLISGLMFVLGEGILNDVFFRRRT